MELVGSNAQVSLHFYLATHAMRVKSLASHIHRHRNTSVADDAIRGSSGTVKRTLSKTK
jgi:hypothetical protein